MFSVHVLNHQHPPEKAHKRPVYLKGLGLGLYILVHILQHFDWRSDRSLHAAFNNDNRVDLAQVSSNVATRMQTMEALYGVFHSCKIYGS